MSSINQLRIDDSKSIAEPSSEISLLNNSEVKLESTKTVNSNGRTYAKIAFGAATIIAVSVLAYFTAESHFNQLSINQGVADLKNLIVSDIQKFNSLSEHSEAGTMYSYTWKYCNGNEVVKKTLDLTHLIYSGKEIEKELQTTFQKIDNIIEENKPRYNFAIEPQKTWNNKRLGLHKYTIELIMC
jgi:hypothetical protein